MNFSHQIYNKDFEAAGKWLAPHLSQSSPGVNADETLDAMQKYEFGKKAAIIGKMVESRPALVVAKTGIGGARVVDMQLGEQPPRIC